MILRNGVRSTLRARGRTVLFTLLIWLLTVSLALGLGMWAYCAQALARYRRKLHLHRPSGIYGG